MGDLTLSPACGEEWLLRRRGVVVVTVGKESDGCSEGPSFLQRCIRSRDMEGRPGPITLTPFPQLWLKSHFL